MNWYNKLDIDKSDFCEKVKNILRNHILCKNLMEHYKIDPSELDDNLDIEIKELKGKFAEGNGKIIRLDPKLFEDNFYKDNFHFIIHEFFHWLKRRSEEKFYFNDPEEVQSFILAMTWDYCDGKNDKEIFDKFYEIIDGFYNEKDNAKEMVEDMMEKARTIYQKIS